MESSNWNWYCEGIQFTPTSFDTERRKILRGKFLQFNKHEAANERNVSEIFGASLLCFECQLNKFASAGEIVSNWMAEICTKCRDTENELLFLFNSIIMEMNYSAPESKSLQSFWPHQNFCHLIYAEFRLKFMTKWSGNMRTSFLLVRCKDLRQT